MWGECEVITLAHISSDVSYGYTESATNEKVGPRFLRITDIQNGVVNWANVPYCSISANNHQKYRLQEGDIVVARTGNSTGENFLYRGNEDAVFASYLIRFRIDRNKADPRFVWYNLRSHDWWHFINNSKTGSAQAGANAKILGLFPLNLPPLAEQSAIAHILGTLDEKIELNRRMNETLEAMARALFKSWFVDFDPVRAKAEGRDTGLPKHIADLFPDSFEDSELGEIPRGWEIKSIGDLADVVGGTTPSTKERSYWEGGTRAWATPKDLSGLSVPVLLDTERRITDAGLSQIGSGLLPKGTVLLSSRAPIGYLAIAEIPVAVNQGFIAMVPKAGTSNLFLLFWASVTHEEIISRANGSTFLEISKANFRPITVVAPWAPVMIAFDRLVRPTYERIVECACESRTLAQLRDTLLPRLTAGDIHVNEVQQRTEAAVVQ